MLTLNEANMAKPELGTKRMDPETGQKFYDLGKDPIVSPYTGKSYPLTFFEGAEATRSSAVKSREKAKSPRAKVQNDEENEDEDEEETVEVEESEDTVSLNEVEEGEADPKAAKTDGPDVDLTDDEDDTDDDADDDTFLADDEDEDDDVSDIIGGGRDDDDD